MIPCTTMTHSMRPVEPLQQVGWCHCSPVQVCGYRHCVGGAKHRVRTWPRLETGGWGCPTHCVSVCIPAPVSPDSSSMSISRSPLGPGCSSTKCVWCGYPWPYTQTTLTVLNVYMNKGRMARGFCFVAMDCAAAAAAAALNSVGLPQALHGHYNF